MPQLLLELFSEEIPARMQKRAEEDLARAFGEKLKAAGLDAKAIKTFSSPRRLGLVIDDLPSKAADVNEEKKGPRVGAPDQAIQGFLKSAGLASIDQAQVVEDKKGAFYVAKIERAGRATAEIVQEIVPEIIRAFPWPKSMRSGVSDLQWVRPLQNILCLFDGKHVAINVDGVPSEAKTWGHRFHAPAAIKVINAADHANKLRAAKVLIDREERKAIILEQAKRVCAAKGLELVDDVGLLEEVAGLVEWPVVLLGDMDPEFLELPSEVVRLSMRTHQKYFAVLDPHSSTGGLAPHFVTVANIEARDGGNAIAAGNARVLSARLNDARYFWDVDRFINPTEKETRQKKGLETHERVEKLAQLVFHQKLGSVWDKSQRVAELAKVLCSVTGADPHLVERAALLSKMDLVTETVGEFPELQGRIGRQLYRFNQGLYVGSPGPSGFENQVQTPTSDEQASDRHDAQKVADAIEEHYLPTGPDSPLPKTDIGLTLALADKLDTLVCFWAINEKPTGSSDPYALRRAALGLIRIVEGATYRLPMRYWAVMAYEVFVFRWQAQFGPVVPLVKWDVPLPDNRGRPGEDILRMLKFAADGDWGYDNEKIGDFLGFFGVIAAYEAEEGEAVGEEHQLRFVTHHAADIADSFIAFLADRLKVQLRDQGKRHYLVDAVFALGDDDLVRIVARVEALDAFLKTEDGANLLAGYKRAANILAAEEKKGKWSAEEATGEVDASKLSEPAEKALFDALAIALPAARAAVEKEEFAQAMKALSSLRAPVDAFFDKVMVNAEDAVLRRNRLLLLSRLREALSAVADFSKIEG